MFTGLVQGLGTISTIGSEKLQVTCLPATAATVMNGLELGDSVAVDGVCLTVAEILPQGFIADVSGETLRRSTLGRSQHAIANLETSLRVGSKLGGHFVTGHVDGLGSLNEVLETTTAWEMTFQTLSEQAARYIVPKGSIAVNGISLTVANCAADGSWFTVAVIPHTYQQTNLQKLELGDWVNLEGDILGKYVEQFLGFQPSMAHGSSQSLDSLSPAFLAEHGYL